MVEFYRHWPSGGLSGLFSQFTSRPGEKEHHRPLIVSLVPHGSILASKTRPLSEKCDDAELIRETLRDMWQPPKQGMKRSRSMEVLACTTCFSPDVEYATMDDVHSFCGLDCYRAHIGEYDVL